MKLRLALLLVAVAAVACGGSDSSGAACDAQHLCPTGQTCASGTCATPPDLEEACGSGCPSGQTCQTGEDFPNGACTMACSGASSCPTLSSCVALPSGSFCLKSCSSAADCPQSFLCENLTGAGSVCVAPQASTSATACSGAPTQVAGGTVGPGSAPSGCVRPVVGSALPGGQVQHLGQHVVGQTVSFSVPSNTASVSVVSQRVSAVDSIVFTGFDVKNSVVPGLLQANGQTLYSDYVNPIDNQTLAPLVYDGVTPTTGVMTYPNTSAALETVRAGGAPSGSWSVLVNDFSYECSQEPSQCTGGNDGGVYDITVLTKPGPLPTQGSVDVAIYLVTESGLTATAALTNPSMQRMVASLAKYYGGAGLCLGTVTFYDVPTWAKTAYAASINVDQDLPCEDLHQMFARLSQPGNLLNFFFVDALHTSAQQGGGTLVGIDGAIPGASSFGGTVASGAAVTMADLTVGVCSGSAPQPSSCGADEVAYIAAHEGAHWMGLYHTTEGQGGTWDPLVDSAACVCNLCVSSARAAKCSSVNANPDGGPTFLDGPDCLKGSTVCGGGDNLMFWELNDSSTGALTAEQSQVILANPVVH
jgi:hypothetical protein